MCSLSGYDSDPIGFGSESQNKKETPDGSTQTSSFSSTSTGSQTSFYTTNEAQTCTNLTDDTLLQSMQTYPPGLGDFLKKVVPPMLDALEDNVSEFNLDSTPQEVVVDTKRLQKIEYVSTDNTLVAAGDQKDKAVLCMTWSCGGNSLAVSYGRQFHEDWCEHGGVIKLYSILKSQAFELCYVSDIEESNCITAMEFHPEIPGLLAYGTAAGDVKVKDIRDMSTLQPNEVDNHSSKRVSYLKWADRELTSKLLWLSASGTTTKIDDEDLALITSGYDGNIIIWHINSTNRTFGKIAGFTINGSQSSEGMVPDISCFDFNHNDCFIVGSKSGQLISCRTNVTVPIADSKYFDPAVQRFETSNFPVLKVTFKSINPYIFVSLFSNSEVNLYKLNVAAPMKVVCMEGVTPCLEWVPKSASLLIFAVANDFQGRQLLKLYDMATEVDLEVKGCEGDKEDLSITSLTINKTFNDRIALGTACGSVYVWKVPTSQFATSKLEGFELYCN